MFRKACIKLGSISLAIATGPDDAIQEAEDAADAWHLQDTLNNDQRSSDNRERQRKEAVKRSSRAPGIF